MSVSFVSLRFSLSSLCSPEGSVGQDKQNKLTLMSLLCWGGTMGFAHRIFSFTVLVMRVLLVSK